MSHWLNAKKFIGANGAVDLIVSSMFIESH